MAIPIAQAKEVSKRFEYAPKEEESREVFLQCWRELSKETIKEKFGQILPTVARQFDGKALNDLKTANRWLAVFDPSSTSDWEDAKSAFLKNGPACLDVLASFTSLIRSEALIGNMLERNVVLATSLLLAILQEIEHIENRYHNPKKVAMQMGPCNFAILWIFQNCEKAPGITDKSTLKDVFLTHIHDILHGLENMNGAPVIVNYKRKIQTFAHQVGCAKVHDEPEANIAELRLFHSTTIGYFANLQDQYMKKEHEAKVLKHHISALQFRYLLEHLTPPHQPGTIYSDAQPGPRWMKFWEEALKNEDGHNSRGTAYAQHHPLKSIVDARNPKRGYMDHGTGARTIHKLGQNGQLYRTGGNLYGTLSDEIHHFPPGEFRIRDDDGWTTLVTDTLRALQPLRRNDVLVNMDSDTGEVKWDVERDRYLQPYL